MYKAILFDSTLCVGCKECESACAKRWGLPYTDAVAAEEKLSDHKLTTIQAHGGRFARRLCMHCAEPTCASVCPVGALQKTTLGAVVYQEDRCIGCRYCMAACPFQVPTYEWNKPSPRIKKCDMCYSRQKAGRLTACTDACPTGATRCGDRQAMIAEARKRLAEKPKEYYQKIYGLREVGGTSLLCLSAVPFEQIGLPSNLPEGPLPALTWRALSAVPDVGALGAVALGGIYWITHRRQAVSAAERGQTNRKEGISLP